MEMRSFLKAGTSTVLLACGFLAAGPVMAQVHPAPEIMDAETVAQRGDGPSRRGNSPDGLRQRAERPQRAPQVRQERREQRQDQRTEDGSGADRQRAQIEQRIRERAATRDAPYVEQERNRTYRDQQRARQDERGSDRGNRGVERQQAEIDRRLRQGGIDRRTGEGNEYWRERQQRAERSRNGWRRDGQWRDDQWRDNRWDNGRGWDRNGWRNDRRYDWFRWRAANRGLFQLDRYYAPYSGYQYRRPGIGLRLSQSFYSNRYWINDPWRYRLPAVYGPYRWVRYYDDVLLVDIYSGQVVDVIHDFFW